MALNKAIRGITIEIGGDTTKLSKALGGIDSELKGTQSKLTEVNKLLKMDPSNITLLTQKQKDLKDAIDSTKDRLKTLKSVQTDSLSPEAYDALQREIAETEQSLDKLKQEYKNFGSVSAQVLKANGEKLKEVGNKISDVGKDLSTKLTVPLVAGFTAAIKETADFDAEMSKVSAISGATGESFDALRDKAREMGAKTKFSATEAGEAMEYMAMAGWKTDDMLQGIEGIMNLAAASGEDLATTSDIVTDAMTAFGLKAEDSGHFADVLAAASSNANTNVAMLGESFKYAAPVAGALGISAEDTSIALGLMANAGIKASQAGTNLRTGLSNLAKPTKQMREYMEKYNIALVTNKDGSVDLRKTMISLREKMAGLSETEQAAAASAIFGKNSMAGWLAIVNASDEDFEKLTKAIDGASYNLDDLTDSLKNSGVQWSKYNKQAWMAGGEGIKALTEDVVGHLTSADMSATELRNHLMKDYGMSAKDAKKTIQEVKKGLEGATGAAESMANTMQDNLMGQLTILKSQLSELMISVGDILMPTIRKITEFIQGLVDKLNNLDEGQKETIVKIGLIVAAIGPALVVIGKVVTGVGSIVSAIGGFIGAVGGLLPGGAIIVGLVAAGTLIYRHWDEIKEWATEKLIPALKKAWEDFQVAIDVAFEAIKKFWTETLEPAWEAMWKWVEETLIPALVKAWGDFKETCGKVFAALKEFWTTTLQPALQNMWTWIVESLIPAIQQGWEDFKTGVGVVFEALKAFWTDTLYPALQAMWKWTIEELIPAIQKGWEDFKVTVGVVFTALKEFWTETLKPALQAMWTWIVESLIPAIQTGWEDFKVAVGVVFEALKGFWNDTLKPALKSMWTWITETFIPAVQVGWENFKEAVGIVFTALKEFWTNTLKPALKSMWTWITETLIPAVQTGWETFKEAVGVVFTALKEFWTVTLKPALQAMWKWITETLIPAIQTAWEYLQPKVEAVFNALKSFWVDVLSPALLAMKKWITETLIPVIQKAWEELQPKVEAVFTAIKGFWVDVLSPALMTMKTWITETLIPAIQKAWENLQPKIESVFTAIKGFWTDTLKPAFEAIKEYLEVTLKPIFENTFNAIKTIVDNTLKAIDNLWNKTVKPIYDGIVTFFSGVFKGDWEKAWNGLGEIVDGIWKGIQTAAELVWENAKTWGSTIIANFYIAFTNAWAIVKDSVLGTWDKITEKVQSIWEDAKNWGTSIIGNFYQSVVAAWDRAVGYVTGIWDKITEKVTSIWEDAKNWGTSIIGNFYVSVVNAWALAVDYVTGIWDAITNKVTEIWEAAKEWGKNLVNNFKNSISEAWKTAIEEIKGWFNQIPEAIQSIVDSALNWGKDLIANFKKGIEDKWNDLKEGVIGIGQGIKDFLGFSKPKEGPLSDFDTYAPDMIALFVKGISDNIKLITAVLGILTTGVVLAFKVTGETAYSQFNKALNGDYGDKLQNAIKSPIENAVDAINRIDWYGVGRRIYDGMTFYTSWISDAYRNAFDFSNMYVKTPHWWVDRWNEISGTYYPEMSVHWYRKAYENPVMFTNPTVLGTAGGLKGFGDGPGGEIVLSADKLREIVGEAGDISINVYAQPGQDATQIAQEVQRILVREQRQRSAAYA